MNKILKISLSILLIGIITIIILFLIMNMQIKYDENNIEASRR